MKHHTTAMKQKVVTGHVVVIRQSPARVGRGSIIIVSDYCNIATGWLELTDEQFEEAKSKHGYEGPHTSRLTLELGGDTPWFDNTQLLKRVQGFHQVSVKVFVSASAFLCACVYVVSPLPPTHTPHTRTFLAGVLPERKASLGNTKRWLLYANPALQEKAVEWVRGHAKRRGKPNMKIKDFVAM